MPDRLPENNPICCHCGLVILGEPFGSPITSFQYHESCWDRLSDEQFENDEPLHDTEDTDHRELLESMD